MALYSPRHAFFLGTLRGKTPVSRCPLILLSEHLSLTQTDLDRLAEQGISSDGEGVSAQTPVCALRDDAGSS